MKFYEYRQNNSGGSFDGPALYVTVEAPSTTAADNRARELDIYFNGCDTGMDCKCCGDRWSEAYDSSDEHPDYTEISSHDSWYRSKDPKFMFAIVLYADDRKVEYPFAPEPKT